MKRFQKPKIIIAIQAIFCLLFALILSLPTYAIPPDSTLDFYNANGIRYLDTTENSNYCYSGDISISGGTAAQKVWSGLLSFLTPEQAAGVIANMQHESNSFNPVQHENSQMVALPNADIVNDSEIAYGIGLIQWSYGRRVRMLHKVQEADASLMTYFLTPEIYSTKGFAVNGDKFLELAGEAVFDRLIQIELEFLKDELNTSYKGIFGTTTVDSAAKYFLDYVEVPVAVREYFHYHNEEYKDAYYAAVAGRQATARKYYEEFSRLGLTPSGSNGTNTTGANITIIGDSITNGSSSAILAKLPGADINAADSRQFTEGITEAKNMELRSTVVFALGTNSQALTETQIQNAINAIGQNKNIYFVTNYSLPERKDLDFTNNNDLLQKAAQTNANVKIIDWNKAVSQNSDPHEYVHNEDGLAVHPTDAGKELFADLIYNAVTSNNLTNNGCSVGGNFQETVLKYAWPTSHPAPFLERMPAYADAVARRNNISTAYVGGTVNGIGGIDCGGFVTTLLQDSGFAPTYNTNDSDNVTVVTDKNRNVPWQEYWAQQHGWTLLNPDVDTPVDTSILQPGDVAYSGGVLEVVNNTPTGPGHTFVYVGNIDGFDSNIASASYSSPDENGVQTGGRAPMAGMESLTTSDGKAVRWYRKGT